MGELAVYLNWGPYKCHRRIVEGETALSERVQTLMRDDVLFHRSGSIGRVLPLSKPRILPLSKPKVLGEKVGISRLTIDAVAMAIDEGPSCFEPNAIWMPHITNRMYSVDYDPYNSASRFARHLRQHMPGHKGRYIDRNQEILGIGI